MNQLLNDRTNNVFIQLIDLALRGTDNIMNVNLWYLYTVSIHTDYFSPLILYLQSHL
ncbi:hypothetical protein J4V37_21270 [Escherichia coli]